MNGSPARHALALLLVAGSLSFGCTVTPHPASPPPASAADRQRFDVALKAGDFATANAIVQSCMQALQTQAMGGSFSAAGDVTTSFAVCQEMASQLSYAEKNRVLAQGAGAAGSPSTPASPSPPGTAGAGASTAAPPATDAAAPALVAATPQPASYALVVGVEHYRDIPAAAGARGDAERMAAVMKHTLGLREDHVRTLLDEHATRGDLLAGLTWLAQNVTPGGRVYFYFSGHGAPAADQSAYLVPYDGNVDDLGDTAVPIADLDARLGQTKAHEIFAMLDSCFSGAGGRSVLPTGARPLMRIKEATPASQMATFTASAGDEISGPSPGETGGAFTKYLVQGIGGGKADIDGDGQVSLSELTQWVSPRVAQDATHGGRSQHPQLSMGAGAGNAQAFVVEYGLSGR